MNGDIILAALCHCHFAHLRKYGNLPRGNVTLKWCYGPRWLHVIDDDDDDDDDNDNDEKMTLLKYANDDDDVGWEGITCLSVCLSVVGFIENAWTNLD